MKAKQVCEILQKHYGGKVESKTTLNGIYFNMFKSLEHERYENILSYDFKYDDEKNLTVINSEQFMGDVDFTKHIVNILKLEKI